MALQMGIVGLPNVGKSTLFRALTAKKVDVANYPFCTIDPNVGVVSVPDPRLDRIAKIFRPQSVIPTTMEFVDIAGLVKGASQGEGLGNQFLSHIRQTNAILHVVRCFEDSQVVHVMGSVDPIRDIEVISTELLLADLDTLEKKYRQYEKLIKSGEKKIQAQWQFLQRLKSHLEHGNPARSLKLEDEDLFAFRRDLHLITDKPVLYALNVSEEDFKKGGNHWTLKVDELAKIQGAHTILICSALEADIRELPEDSQLVFLQDLGVSESALSRLIRESYSLLGLQTFFTAGPKEVRAWTILKGTTAPKAAGQIHSDFERGFIRAEVYSCQDLFELGSENAVKEKGRYRIEGKDYVVQDGDIIFFRFNV